MKIEPQSPVLLYQTSDGQTRLEVRMENETIWLSQSQMAELFQTSIPNVSMHIRNVFAEGELQEAATVKDFLIVRQEGRRQVTRTVEHYNLDVIISVGYRVKSHRGTQFRIWATERLREYVVKGFADLLGLTREIGDFVIVHELLHFNVPNHGRLWKSLMCAHLGDYSAAEQRLKEITGVPDGLMGIVR